MARTSRVIALALTVAGAAGFLFPAAPRARAGVARRGASEDASCQLETELGVMAANNAFYDAFRDGDIQAMAANWHPAEGECSLILPGQRPVVGRDNVLSSWETVLGSATQIAPSDVTVICAAGEVAWVHSMMKVRVCRANAQMGDGPDLEDEWTADMDTLNKDSGMSYDEVRKARAEESSAEEFSSSAEVRARRRRARRSPLSRPFGSVGARIRARAMTARAPRTVAQANLAITNMFKRDEAGVWKMVAHQAGLVQE